MVSSNTLQISVKITGQGASTVNGVYLEVDGAVLPHGTVSATAGSGRPIPGSTGARTLYALVQIDVSGVSGNNAFVDVEATIAGNGSPSAHQKNRRTEFKVLDF